MWGHQSYTVHENFEKTLDKKATESLKKARSRI